MSRPFAARAARTRSSSSGGTGTSRGAADGTVSVCASSSPWRSSSQSAAGATLMARSPYRQRVDRSLQTAARAKPARPDDAVASAGSTAAPERDRDREVTGAGFLHALEGEARVEERPEELGERQVRRADPRPQALRRDPGRVLVAADAAVPAAVQLRDALSGDEERVRADEAGMHADVDERRSGLQDARDLPADGREVVDVGVRPERDGGVELAVAERQLLAVPPDDLQAAPAREAKLVVGRIDADHRPARLGESHRVEAGAAADVEQAAGSASEQPLGGVRDDRIAEEGGLVPLGEPVVARTRHGADASLGPPGCPVRG